VAKKMTERNVVLDSVITRSDVVGRRSEWILLKKCFQSELPGVLL